MVRHTVYCHNRQSLWKEFQHSRGHWNSVQHNYFDQGCEVLSVQILIPKGSRCCIYFHTNGVATTSMTQKESRRPSHLRYFYRIRKSIKIGSALVWNMLNRSERNCAHVTTFRLLIKWVMQHLTYDYKICIYCNLFRIRGFIISHRRRNCKQKERHWNAALRIDHILSLFIWFQNKFPTWRPIAARLALATQSILEQCIVDWREWNYSENRFTLIINLNIN